MKNKPIRLTKRLRTQDFSPSRAANFYKLWKQGGRDAILKALKEKKEF